MTPHCTMAGIACHYHKSCCTAQTAIACSARREFLFIPVEVYDGAASFCIRLAAIKKTGVRAGDFNIPALL